MNLHRPLNIAHQGASIMCPPNTMAAFRAARLCGADVIELDVTHTRDGAVVVSHDLTVDRCTDRHGYIPEMSLAEVRACDAGTHFGPQYAGERIPLLAEVLDWAHQAAMRLCIEVKGDSDASYLRTVGATLDLLRQNELLPAVTLTSFSPACIRVAREWEPRLAWGLDPDELRCYTGWELVQQVLACGATFLLHKHTILSADVINEAHAHGFAVWAWTADDPADLRRLIDLDVDAIMTNRPDVLATVLAHEAGGSTR